MSANSETPIFVQTGDSANKIINRVIAIQELKRHIMSGLQSQFHEDFLAAGLLHLLQLKRNSSSRQSGLVLIIRPTQLSSASGKESSGIKKAVGAAVVVSC